MELKELISFLRSQGVKRFKNADIEFEFSEQAPEPPKLIEAKLPDNMPPELKNPELMKMDQVLNWSAGGEDPLSPIDGTGDVPINGGEI